MKKHTARTKTPYFEDQNGIIRINGCWTPDEIRKRVQTIIVSSNIHNFLFLNPEFEQLIDKYHNIKHTISPSGFKGTTKTYPLNLLDFLCGKDSELSHECGRLQIISTEALSWAIARLHPFILFRLFDVVNDECNRFMTKYGRFFPFPSYCQEIYFTPVCIEGSSLGSTSDLSNGFIIIDAIRHLGYRQHPDSLLLQDLIDPTGIVK